jgi:hypothetical protein
VFCETPYPIKSGISVTKPADPKSSKPVKVFGKLDGASVNLKIVPCCALRIDGATGVFFGTPTHPETCISFPLKVVL